MIVASRRDAGVLEMPSRQRDAPLPVELLEHGAGGGEALQRAALAAQWRRLQRLLLEVALELVRRIAGETALVAPGDVDAVGEDGAQASRDGDAVLRIEREFVLPHQYRPLHGRHSTPLLPTLQQLSPPSPHSRTHDCATRRTRR